MALAGLGLLACRRGDAGAIEASREEIPDELLDVSAPPPPAAAMRSRPIPASGELLPVIGLAVGPAVADPSNAAKASTRKVLRVLRSAGGRLIDAPARSPDAETFLGELANAAESPRSSFLAARVWTSGREAGQAQMEQSLDRLQRRRIDLMQIHELTDFAMQLETLRRWRVIGHARYIGATVSRVANIVTLAEKLPDARLDFVQVPYSILVRAAEERLLPAAADHGVAVLVAQPFAGGRVFETLRRRPLPEWAAELECTTWSQLLLKWLLAHPAVGCVLPATHDPRHMLDNTRAGLGPLPDAAQQRQLAGVFA
ncbi:aldo/keto reductase [Nannocystis sp.]|uniref:aldo/keto reductase n=1 Tax=Nannocystis sp. TaxID=1962667 RepID=UPI002429C4B0|nr:aldo/keto reductase [Nannocystis sp.]MBK7825609.1 aldo/keto reductase [Nannocystis sp.]MBK9756681.1 aldo/keto reductase [Nannocystis sp.]